MDPVANLIRFCNDVKGKLGKDENILMCTINDEGKTVVAVTDRMIIIRTKGETDMETLIDHVIDVRYDKKNKELVVLSPEGKVVIKHTRFSEQNQTPKQAQESRP